MHRRVYKQRNPEELFNIYEKFMACNNKLNLTLGNMLEKLNNNFYIYVHDINYWGKYILSREEDLQKINDIENNICLNGLRLTSMGNEVGKIKYTTISTKEDDMLSVIERVVNISDGLVVLAIPKEEVDEKEEIIGSDISPSLTFDNQGFVLPKYVIGYFKNGEFVKNPYDYQERKQYEFTTSEIDDGAQSDSERYY